MDFNFILGTLLLAAIVAIGTPELMHHPKEYAHVPAMMIVIGGSLYAMIAGTQFKNFKTFLFVLRFIFFPRKLTSGEQVIEIIVNLSKISLSQGRLALIPEIDKIKDPFLQYGIQMVVDKFQEPFIRAALYNSIEEMQERHMVTITAYKNAAVVAPVCGMVGTIVGLIQVLRNMSDPSNLGKAMALGLIATFYGGFMSGMVYTPINQKLKILSDEEASLKRMMTEGILFVAKGEVPLKIEKYLVSYLNFNNSKKEKDEK